MALLACDCWQQMCACVSLCLLVFCLLPLQPSYSVDGIFASIIAFCIKPEGPEVTAFATAVHVFPKKALYGPPPSADSAADFKVWRATYLPAQSWYYSLPARDQVLQFDADPLPGYEVATEVSAPVRPALPQTAQDAADPVIVMGKVCRQAPGQGGDVCSCLAHAEEGVRTLVLACTEPFPWRHAAARQLTLDMYAPLLPLLLRLALLGVLPR